MAIRPDFCPECDALWRVEWRTQCGECNHSLSGEETAKADSPSFKQAATPKSTKVAIGVIAAFVFAPISILVACIAIVTFIGGAASQADKKESPANDDITALQAAADVKPDEKVKSLVVEQSLLDKKWATAGPGYHTSTALELFEDDDCFPEDKRMRPAAQVDATFTYNTQPVGTYGAFMGYTAVVADTADDAEHQHNRYSGKNAETCVTAILSGAVSQLGLVRDVKLEYVERNLEVSAVDFRVATTVQTPFGTAKPSAEFIELYENDSRIQIVFVDCNCALGPPPDKDTVINDAVRRLKEANKSSETAKSVNRA